MLQNILIFMNYVRTIHIIVNTFEMAYNHKTNKKFIRCGSNAKPTRCLEFLLSSISFFKAQSHIF